MTVWLAGIVVLLLRQLALDSKDGVALLPQSGQEGVQVEVGEGLGGGEQGVEVPVVTVDAAYGEPMLLQAQGLAVMPSSARSHRLAYTSITSEPIRQASWQCIWKLSEHCQQRRRALPEGQ